MRVILCFLTLFFLIQCDTEDEFEEGFYFSSILIVTGCVLVLYGWEFEP